MSGYRNYTSWNKGNVNSTYSGSSSSKPDVTSSKYESNYSRTGSDTKRTMDGGSSLRLGQKYSSYSSGYQRDGSASRDAGKYSGSSGVTSRYKEPVEKKDTSHPPISYRPLARSGTHSRDPSLERDSVDRTLAPANYNRLYPGPYSTRSVSRERTESTSSSSTIPKYTGRSSTSKDDVYALGRTSRNTSREDLSTTKFKTTSRATSREDLEVGPKKYITSRFLPKNTVEKSNTAYTRPTSSRIASSQRETSRKNRELLNLLSTQNDTNKSSRPVSRCSSNLSENSSNDKANAQQNDGTCSNESPQASFLKCKRTEVSRITEKQAKPHCDVDDKQTHSDKSDENSKNSKGSSNSATPWSSYLDLKFSSPRNDTKSTKSSPSPSQNGAPKEKPQRNSSNSPKNLSRNNSSKSINHSNSNSKLNGSPPKASQQPELPKKLPPQIPSFMVPNKDFRKSVLNMNADGKPKKFQRSGSVSSAESELEIPLSETTDVSENLSSCKSFHKSSSPSVSKLPKRTTSEATDSRNRRSNTRSPSVPSEGNSSSAAATSGSEDDSKGKSSKSKSESKQKKRNVASSRTSLLASSADESALDKSPKPPISPRPKNEGPKSEAEAKSFLMRALAPVTNLFKVKHQDSSEKINWMDGSSENVSESREGARSNGKLADEDEKTILSLTESGERAWWLNQNQEGSENSNGNVPSNLPRKIIVQRVPSGEKAWWLDSNSQTDSISKTSKKYDRKILPRVESGEKAWWLDGNVQVPEGVQIYPAANTASESSESAQRKIIYHVPSGEKPWWLDENAEAPEGVQIYVTNKPAEENIMTPEYLQKHQIRHIDSGERAWWLCSNENISEAVNKQDEVKNGPVYKISHQNSGEKAWWLGSSDSSKKHSQDISDSEGDDQEIPLGDRASPEGLEMPKENEQGRLTPYDNVPSSHPKPKRPDSLFISRHKNIDDILGGASQRLSPLLDRIFGYQEKLQFLEDECEEVNPDQVKIHDSTPQHGIIQPNRVDIIGGFPTSSTYGKVGDSIL